MTAKTDAQRKADQRARDKLRDEERRERLLAYTLKVEVYRKTADDLAAIAGASGIDEEHDIITRLINAAGRMPPEQIRELIRLP